MSIFSFCVGLAVLCIVVGVILEFRDKENPHRFSKAILGVVLGLTVMIGEIAYETYDSATTFKDIGSLLNLPGESQREFIKEYAANASSINRFQNPFLSHQGDTVQNDFQGRYSKLAQGVVEVPFNRLMSMALTLTNQARKEILATSVFSTDWDQRWSHEYWQQQKERIEQQHLTLRRIFILNGPSKADCESVFREQAEAGVGVSFIDAKQVNPDENKDFIIIDHSIDHSMAAELVLGANSQILSGRVFVDPKDVNTYYETFQSLAAKAETYKPH